MPQVIPSRRPWRFYLVAGAVCLGVFVWADGHLFAGNSSGHGAVEITEKTSAPATNGPDAAISNQAMQALAEKLGDVDGLNDLVVLPDGTSGHGFNVSATVDLGAQATAATSTQAAIDKAVDTFYRDVYTSGQPISQAELTFTNDNLIVASSGLGKTAYEQLASSTMNGDLAAALAEAKPVDESSSAEEWLEMKSTQ